MSNALRELLYEKDPAGTAEFIPLTKEELEELVDALEDELTPNCGCYGL